MSFLKRFFLLLLVCVLVVTSSPVKAEEEPAAEQKLIALTFDDGPTANTISLLDGLRDLGVVATFFINRGADGNEDILARMVAEGHQLANHTYNHYVPLSELSVERINEEVSLVEDYLYAAMGGSYLELVRTPGGDYSNHLRETIQHPIIYWTVDTRDWESRDANAVYGHLMGDTVEGSIILMHDPYSTTVEAILRAIPVFREQGYEFVTVSELFRRKGIDLVNGVKVYYAEGPVVLPAYSAPSVSADTFAATRAQVVISGPAADLGGVAGMRAEAAMGDASGGGSTAAALAEAAALVAGTAADVLQSADGGYDVSSFTGFDLQYHYTLDGSVPDLASPVYSEPLWLPQGTVLTVMGFDRYGTRTPMTAYTVEVPNLDFVLSKISGVKNAASKEASSAPSKEDAPGFSKGSLRQ